MKGIAIETIAVFLLAIVSIIILIMFVGTNFSSTIKKGYCYVVMGFSGILPLPESMKPPLPAFCTESSTYQYQVPIEGDDPNAIAYNIASYSLACWKKTGEINIGQDRNCYELILKRLSGEVTKEKVVAELPADYKDKIDWQAGLINTPKSVGIYYNATSNLVVVV
jgi:hypothetical protein